MNDRKKIKFIKYLLTIKTYGEFCIIASKMEKMQDSYCV